MPDVAVLVEALDRLLEASMQVVREERLAPIERRLERNITQAFRAEGRAFMRGFAHLNDPSKFPLDEAQWMRYLVAAQAETLPLFTAALDPAVKEALMAGVLSTAESLPGAMPTTESLREAVDIPVVVDWLVNMAVTVLGIRFDLRNPRAVAYLEEHAAALVTRIDETTRDYIRTVIVEGASVGASYNEMAKRLIERYKEFAIGKPQKHIDSRAHLIAVTEVGEAYSRGNYIVGEGLRDAGLQMEKSWDTVGDDRVSAGCRENEAAGWIPFDATFPSGHLRPLRFPGCRCALLMRTV